MSTVCLVGPEIEENLSLRYLAGALTRVGHTVRIVAFNQPEALAGVAATILREEPELVGLSLAFQWRARDFLALAMALREGGYEGHITTGGHFATFTCDELITDFPELDSVVRQEAEQTIVELVAALDTGRPLSELRGLCLRDAEGKPYRTGDAPLPDLAGLAWPDRRGEPAACFAHPIAPVVSTRGCYANCTFCCIAAWHEQSLPGKRYRERPLVDLADEMAAQHDERGIDIFVFHDDNFFLPSARRNLERIDTLAQLLQERGVTRFATVVKARPNDAKPEVFAALRDRLQCIRVYVGIETDADQGLKTLGRWARSRQNHEAIEVVQELGLYTCFNMLLFDPDTTLESLRTNLAFIRHAAEFPFNFGRTELYAGTPLLRRMRAEGRARGDWMQWDYDLATPEVSRVWQLALACFRERNFGDRALANHLMGTRFDIEVVRHFHRAAFDPAWLAEGKALSGTLAHDSADALERIVEHVDSGAPPSSDAALVAELSAGLRSTEAVVRGRARALGQTLQRAAGQGRPLTDLGDLVATSLQRGVAT